jgi:hypothetical protein
MLKRSSPLKPADVELSRDGPARPVSSILPYAGETQRDASPAEVLLRPFDGVPGVQ